MVGPHVFGDGRIGCWVTPTYHEGEFKPESFRDKLRDRCPKLKAFGVTDIFLPREADSTSKTICRASDLYVALYEAPPAGLNAQTYAQQTVGDVTRLAVGAVELNIEGVADDKLADFVRAAWTSIRVAKAGLRLRINVVPFKGQFLPADLFTDDRQLFVIVQNYLGNMDERVAEDEIVRNLVDYGIPREKVSVMYGAHIGQPRVRALPRIRFRGSLYQDDLLSDGGYL